MCIVVFGHDGHVVNSTRIVLWNNGLHFLAIKELVGAKGKADRYRWGVLVAITTEAKSTNLTVSSANNVSCGSPYTSYPPLFQ
jgi:hypothetical protein